MQIAERYTLFFQLALPLFMSLRHLPEIIARLGVPTPEFLELTLLHMKLFDHSPRFTPEAAEAPLFELRPASDALVLSVAPAQSPDLLAKLFGSRTDCARLVVEVLEDGRPPPVACCRGCFLVEDALGHQRVLLTETHGLIEEFVDFRLVATGQVLDCRHPFVKALHLPRKLQLHELRVVELDAFACIDLGRRRLELLIFESQSAEFALQSRRNVHRRVAAGHRFLVLRQRANRVPCGGAAHGRSSMHVRCFEPALLT
mmetsp:Transcript_18656/g.51164  ORF Transcript_18656/g.51164 Transcript_18656/m.51164 type:complete len:258 (+) Transcript_18656:418-1191(+)